MKEIFFQIELEDGVNFSTITDIISQIKGVVEVKNIESTIPLSIENSEEYCPK